MTNDAIVLELNDILNRIAYLRSCILDIDAARAVDSGACPAPTESVKPSTTIQSTINEPDWYPFVAPSLDVLIRSIPPYYKSEGEFPNDEE